MLACVCACGHPDLDRCVFVALARLAHVEDSVRLLASIVRRPTISKQHELDDRASLFARGDKRSRDGSRDIMIDMIDAVNVYLL